MAGSMAASISMRCLCFFSIADISLNYGEKKTLSENEAKEATSTQSRTKQKQAMQDNER
jgi:hypothetical protein